MSAATFACPHCGHQYPVKPVLVGKVVRCTACKNPFRLRPDGIADKVEAAPGTASHTAAPAVAAPRPAPVAPAPAPQPRPLPPAAAPVPAPKPAAPEPKPLSPPTPKAGMTRQQEDARKAMAESLRSSMGEALKAEAMQAEADAGSQKPGAKSDRKRPSGLFRPPKDPKQAGKGPAILTGEGEREAEIQRRWWIVAGIAVVLVALLVFLFTRTSERTDAVRAFTAELPAKDNRYGARLPAIQARAWQPGITAFVQLPAPSFGGVHEIPSGTLDQGLSPIRGLTWIPEAGRWVAPDKADWLKRQLAEDAKTVPARLERAGIVSVDPPALRKALLGAGLGEPEADLLLPLLQGGPLAAKLGGGSAPTIRWCTVSGRGGTYLHDPGQQYRFTQGDYQGVLAQFQGEGWPGEWKFLTLDVVKK